MDRKKLVEIAYQKGKELNLNNKDYLSWLETFFDKEYVDDVGAGDITSEAVLAKNKPRKAVLKAEESGVLGGIEEVSWFYRKHRLEVNVCIKDGEEALEGETILEIQGGQKDILATERIVLNVLQRMSGVATETKRLTDLLREYPTRIAATRKAPLRYLDKKAVFLGGGLTHRFGLWDSILIKDNHLEALKSEGVKNYVETAIIKASAFADSVGFIEIEVTSPEEAVRAARKFKDLRLKKPCVVMLDNMSPVEIGEAIETLRKGDLYDHVLLEASGEITRENISEYARTGIDVVSLGYLTHSARVLDMSLEMTL
ncbi:MAG: carboxylating nicotinate-nucleotide diphosphorylase [Candidatus Bathyarchaeota archaeon]|nr:carboxylating nicotinate-nucleotide diphosphorylase [Candidatus Bathyarchaeota archaeon]